jgi:isochorismate hydrolase
MRSTPFLTHENVNEKLDDWLQEVARFSYPRRNLVLKPGKCALLVVDMLNYFAHPRGRVYLPSSAAVVPRIARLLRFWRNEGHRVVYTRHCHRGPEDLGMLGKFFSDYIKCGEWDAEIIEELSPMPSDVVFRKSTYDAFLGTGLEEHLRSAGVQQVLITGVLTQMCCETTARAAFVRGFEVYLPADALTTTSERLHVGSLVGLSTSVAVVTSVGDICGNTGNSDA